MSHSSVSAPIESTFKLFLASAASLFVELLLIRYLSTEIRVFAYLKNVPLIACFFGIGLGIVIGRPVERLARMLPVLFAALLFMTRFAPYLGLTHIGNYDSQFLQFGDVTPLRGVWAILVPNAVICVVLALIIAICVAIGGFVGQFFESSTPLRSYGVNLAGSFFGMALFTIISWLELPPGWWVALACILLLPFYMHQKKALAVFALASAVIAVPQPGTYWSPYYRVDLEQLASPAGYSKVASYYLHVNHDYHQKMVDLSPDFIRQFPTHEPNHSALDSYEFPYRIVKSPEDVLIVGAGTGNDVAAALRHGAHHIDAVEIDPVIQKIGMRLHPESPYSSPRVSPILNDARSFFKSTQKRYDLIVFGYLDSHTMLSSHSAIRLDNFVYTVESFREAKALLKPGGTAVIAFAAGIPVINERFFKTIHEAFGEAPTAFGTDYDGGGIVYVEPPLKSLPVTKFASVSGQLQAREKFVYACTDDWPFLFMPKRVIPMSILIILIVFLIAARRLVRFATGTEWQKDPHLLQMFFLGSGFLLLETKAVTQLSLLFGATWIVNVIAISAFLCMAMLANFVSIVRQFPLKWIYALLFSALVAGSLFSISSFNSQSGIAKVFFVGLLIALPVFFSGLAFSQLLRQCGQPKAAFGVNLLGAVIGGMLENVVLVTGIQSLSVLAIILYGASAICVWKANRVPKAAMAAAE